MQQQFTHLSKRQCHRLALPQMVHGEEGGVQKDAYAHEVVEGTVVVASNARVQRATSSLVRLANG
jgi:hypothetical protein